MSNETKIQNPMDSVPTTSPAETLYVLEVARKARISVLIWGPPGVGKSSLVEMTPRTMANGEREPMTTLIGAIMDPTEVMGFPSKTEVPGPAGTKQEIIKFIPREWVQDIVNAGQGVLFTDELTTCPPAVQNALLRLVLNRVAGDVKLPDDTLIVAAANPVGDILGGHELSPAMANRFLHVHYKPNKVTGGGVGNMGQATNFITAMTQGWDAVYEGVPQADQVQPLSAAQAAQNKAMVLSFLQRNPSQIGTEKIQHGVLTYPTQRVWDSVIRVGEYLPFKGGTDLQNAVVTICVQGLVGQGAAGEFFAHIRNMDLPDPMKVLDDPTILDVTKSSVLWATTLSVMGIFEASKGNEQQALEICGKLSNFFDYLQSKNKKEFAVPFLQQYIQIWLKLDDKKRPRLTTLLSKYRDELNRLKRLQKEISTLV